MRHAHGFDQFGAGDSGCTGAVDDHAGPGDIAPGQAQRIDQAGRGDDRGAVLIVVEDRNVEQLL